MDQLESYFRLLELMLLVALQVLQQFLLLVVLLELQEQKLVFQQELPLLEQIEEQLALLLDFVLQH